MEWNGRGTVRKGKEKKVKETKGMERKRKEWKGNEGNGKGTKRMERK